MIAPATAIRQQCRIFREVERDVAEAMVGVSFDGLGSPPASSVVFADGCDQRGPATTGAAAPAIDQLSLPQPPAWCQVVPYSEPVSGLWNAFDGHRRGRGAETRRSRTFPGFALVL